MKLDLHPFHRMIRRACLGALAAVACGIALAAPGAHGPDGEHLDEKHQAVAGNSLPRVEAKSDLFELVAQLRANELTILVDRYDSNEPVLGAKLDVATGALKAVAAFRPESGDYAVTDAALLKALAAGGEHALVFTVIAGNDADLLDATLVSAADAGGHGHDHGHGHGHGHGMGRAAWAAVVALALGLAGGGMVWLRRRQRNAAILRTGKSA
jgi:hypothetical protein